MNLNFKKILSFVNAILLATSFSLPSIYSTDNAENPSTEHTPKVSVIVPVYKAEKYIEQCLDSLVNQTIDRNKLEIICVNDGSPDNSIEILNKYAEKDNRIKVITQKNGGVSSARNNGIEHATGKYIAFVDSDDYVDKNTYEDASRLADKKDADITCFGWRNFTDDGSKSSRKNCLLDEKIFTNWKKAKKERASIISCNKLYKRKLLIENNIRFSRDIRMAEDECFNLCVYPYAKTIIHIPYVLYNYRVNTNSATQTISFKYMISNYLKVWKNVNKFYKEHNISFSLWDRITYFKVYKDDFWAYVLPALGL